MPTLRPVSPAPRAATTSSDQLFLSTHAEAKDSRQTSEESHGMASTSLLEENPAAMPLASTGWRRRSTAKAGAVFGAVGIAYCSFGHLVPTPSRAYDGVTKKYQGVVNDFAKQLNLEPPRFFVHQSLPGLSPFGALNVPEYGLQTRITMGSNEVTTLPDASIQCWIGHELGHFCEAELPSCDVPDFITPLASSRFKSQMRERRADEIAAYLCGQQEMLDMLEGLRQTEYTFWPIASNVSVHDTLRAFSTHGSAQQRIEQVLSPGVELETRTKDKAIQIGYYTFSAALSLVLWAPSAYSYLKSVNLRRPVTATPS